jgi:four helix bundle protein
MTEDRWKRLDVWKMADELAYKIYLSTKEFPKEEKFGLISQVRRAALSVPTNIVEGYSRKGDKELAHFLSISLGSLAETKYLLHFSNKLSYFTSNQYPGLKEGYDILGAKLWKLYEKVKKPK